MLIEYLHEKKPYLNIDFSLHQIAKDLDIPQAKVIDIFKSNLKMSFPIYRNQLRVEYAIGLLKNDVHKSMSIEGIAYQSGFKTKSSFYSAFRSIYQMTPTEWIEKNLN